MDRFIGVVSGIIYDIITDLKSNMDRFIALSFCHLSGVCIYLKSNMDRFIATSSKVFLIEIFIFKIQYG